MIVDETVYRLHKKSLPEMPTIQISATEANKSLKTVRNIYEKLTEFKVDRKTLIWCVGGGITTDIGAFVAATYMRGLPFILVPTTLLASVDAAVGGKCGVNFDGFKNLVGTFAHPTEVIFNQEFLTTLQEKEIQNGISEIIKHACIADRNLFCYLESHPDLPGEVKEGKGEIISLIEDSVSIKIDIVMNDERETGKRKLLNFGHTLGHAIETVTGIPHGSAVSIGMAAASYFSVKLDLLKEKDANRIVSLLRRFSLPVKIPVSPKMLVNALWHDKKKDNVDIEMVFLSEIGSPKQIPIPIRQLEIFLNDLCYHP